MCSLVISLPLPLLSVSLYCSFSLSIVCAHNPSSSYTGSSSSFSFSLPPSVPPSSLPLTPLHPSSLTSAMVYYLMLLETKLK